MTQSPPPRARNRRVLLAVSALLVAGLAVAGIVLGVNAAADRSAAQELRDATAALTGARSANAAAAQRLAAAVENARSERDRGDALSGAVDPEMIADPALKTSLETATQELAKSDELGESAVSTAAPPASTLPSARPEARAERIAAAKLARSEAKSLTADAAALERRAQLLDDAADAVRTAASALIASAHEKATSLEVPAQASQESRDAFSESVSALQSPDAAVDLAALVQRYQEAWKAVVESDAAAQRAASFPRPPGGSGGGAGQPTYINGILVVNKTYALPSWYGNGLTPELTNAFNAMRAAAAADGINLWIVSGFRSYATQVATYNQFVANYGQAFADTTSARPGHSEHQSGLAIDVNLVDQSFGSTPEGIWVRDNAQRFGFVIRYPQGKEHITGYMWEPWHLRYLGGDLAATLASSGLTLEEYLGIDSRYSS